MAQLLIKKQIKFECCHFKVIKQTSTPWQSKGLSVSVTVNDTASSLYRLKRISITVTTESHQPQITLNDQHYKKHSHWNLLHPY